MFQEIHNTTEDVVFAQVTEIFDFIEKEGSAQGFCTCSQCRRDTACYVLNRTVPRYVVSNRGVARVEQTSIERQQFTADIAAKVWEGLKQVHHNQRPAGHEAGKGIYAENDGPAFNIPTIVGRLLNGSNFEPLSEIAVELRRDGELVRMRNSNWQNPYHLVANTEGTFTFWPYPIPADAAGTRTAFEFSIRVAAGGFETLNHFFKLPVISEKDQVRSYSMARTFKLPDLYMFPPGGDENIYLKTED
ncbi:MAG: late competence development ComFB family protein [Spirochaetaceae bacterium]|jgi:competence protein ComFB|nr:late competence development ComFB family protein [Spirochaetaceae bacterium]